MLDRPRELVDWVEVVSLDIAEVHCAQYVEMCAYPVEVHAGTAASRTECALEASRVLAVSRYLVEYFVDSALDSRF